MTTPTAPPTTTTPSPPPTKRHLTALHNLQTLYNDLTLLHTIAAPTIQLHPADRDLTTPPRPPLVGVAAAQKHEEDLVKAAGGRLVMDVGRVVVDEGGVFGCVMGVLRGFGDSGGSGDDDSSSVGGSAGVGDGPASGVGAGAAAGEETEDGDGKGTGKGKRRGDIEMPFCGVWKFDEEGRAIVHWENAEDPAALGRWLRGE